MSGGGRETALEVLTACRRLDAWSDGSLKAACKKNGLEPREAAFAARLVYGVLQNRALLDFYLDCFCTGPFDKLEPFVRDVLRLGAYQILFMDRVPSSAAVHQAVEMVKTHRRQRSAGLVNAVLRKVSQNAAQLPPIPEADVVSAMALRYSHPAWLVERLMGLVGREEAEGFLQGDNTPAPITIQRNPLTCDRETLLDYWEGRGAAIQPHPWLADCFFLTGGGSLEEDRAFQAGWFQVQDAAARLAVLAAGPRPGDRVLDVCAAPGGKSFACAIAMENQGHIISCDIHPKKLEAMARDGARLGVTCVETAVRDGRSNDPAWNGAFDLVLCDVPCSGLGIIRKKPDIRYKDPVALAALPPIQGAILDNASRYVRPGGVLLYSTCTILPEENEAVVEAFLAGHGDFAREPFLLPGPAGQTEGAVTLWPQRHGTDGFYVCKLRKL